MFFNKCLTLPMKIFLYRPLFSFWIHNKDSKTTTVEAQSETKASAVEDPKPRTPSVAGAGMNGDPKSLYKEARSQLKQASKPDFATRGKAKDLDGGEAESADQNPVEKLIRQASISKQQNAEAAAAAQGAQGTATSGLGKTAKVVLRIHFAWDQLLFTFKKVSKIFFYFLISVGNGDIWQRM